MENLNKYIEHTLLKQDATHEDLIKLFEEAKEHKFLGVCINPAYVKLAKEHLKGTGIKVVTVIGFPLGANLPSVKAYEAACAVEDGADEIDMVINVSAIKDKNYDYVQAGADFVKTSTGFVKNGVGAKVEDVKLMYETVSPHGLKVKASGGIRDKETAIKLIEAGASRLGTSSGVKIVQ